MKYRRSLLTAFGLILTACATAPVVPLPPPEPIVHTVTVDKIVQVPCVSMVPAEPEYPATAAALGMLTPDFNGAWLGISLLKGEIAVRKADQDQLRAILQGCAKP